ncbi:hypothetical protein CCYA_CCYA01G0206 [Cyanidiococcus yangmingshanensis]|nr:hypothetical protein CCYA_CCYA01G0206 [Cyanidiococcus yangmingshanensis]
MHRIARKILQERLVHQQVHSKGSEITVALSGGVDSAISAWLLKQEGLRVRGVFLRSWGTGDEKEDCAYRDDRLAAQQVAGYLKLDDFQEIDLRPEYWNEVFMPHFVEGYRNGLTPNPDLACNRYIKFGVLLRHATRQTNLLATGHYARCHNGQLFRAFDRDKDQTYFLASVAPDALTRLRFPLGHWTKKDVRALARELGLPNANRASSRGICFVGRRGSITSLLDEFLPTSAAWRAIDVDTGRLLGFVSPYLTLGQRVRLGGLPHAFYVCDKDPQSGVLYVCAGRSNPALFCWGYDVEPFDLWRAWIDREQARSTSDCIRRGLHFQAWYRQTPSPCIVRLCNQAESASPGDAAQTHLEANPQSIQLIQVIVPGSKPSAPVTAPGQAVVLYHNDLCIGGGTVRRLIRELENAPPWLTNCAARSTSLVVKDA